LQVSSFFLRNRLSNFPLTLALSLKGEGINRTPVPPTDSIKYHPLAVFTLSP
jgi:hypothetical protein